MSKGPVSLYRQHKDGLQLLGFVFLAGASASNLYVSRDSFEALQVKVNQIALTQAVDASNHNGWENRLVALETRERERDRVHP